MKPGRNARLGKEVLGQPCEQFTTVATAPDPKLNTNRLIYLTLGGTGSVPCLSISNGTNWKQIAIGANAI